MAEAHEAAGAPGAMAALLRPNEAAVHRLCREVAEETGLVLGVANYNGPGQVVISGHAAAVARAVESARPQRAAARAVDLPVGAAFHSPYMWSAAERIAALVGTDAGVLRAELGALSVGDASPEELDAVLARCVDRDGAEAEAAEVAVGDATVPIVSNTTATAATAAAALRWRATLHSPAPVQWGRSLQEARRLDATAFLEVGTGAVQTGIVGQVLGKGVETRCGAARVRTDGALAHPAAQGFRGRPGGRGRPAGSACAGIGRIRDSRGCLPHHSLQPLCPAEHLGGERLVGGGVLQQRTSPDEGWSPGVGCVSTCGRGWWGLRTLGASGGGLPLEVGTHSSRGRGLQPAGRRARSARVARAAL